MLAESFISLVDILSGSEALEHLADDKSPKTSLKVIDLNLNMVSVGET